MPKYNYKRLSYQERVIIEILYANKKSKSYTSNKLYSMTFELGVYGTKIQS